MTTFDHPVLLQAASVDPPGRFRCRRSVFACEPRYRILRVIRAVARLRAFRHAGLRALIGAHWQHVRSHSSWSRA